MNMLKKQFYLFALLSAVLVSILSSSCKRQAAVRETVKAMTDCTLSFPLSLNIINADQIEDRDQLSYGGKMKLVMYVPPEACSTCRISKFYITDTLFRLTPPAELVPMVIVQPSKEKRDSIVQAIRNAWFEFPVYEDPDGEFMNVNPAIPSGDGRFHTFLVDESNHITLIGDPTMDPRVLELYIKALSK